MLVDELEERDARVQLLLELGRALAVALAQLVDGRAVVAQRLVQLVAHRVDVNASVGERSLVGRLGLGQLTAHACHFTTPLLAHTLQLASLLVRLLEALAHCRQVALRLAQSGPIVDKRLVEAIAFHQRLALLALQRVDLALDLADARLVLALHALHVALCRLRLDATLQLGERSLRFLC